MTKDDLMLAFRMIAMGRPNTPHTEALADFLLSLAPAVEIKPAVLEVEVPEVAVKLQTVTKSVPAFETDPASLLSSAELKELAGSPAKRVRKPKAD